ncbi:MAG: GNVR domain-containing protein [Candidatus Firestonebacteria bacterium]
MAIETEELTIYDYWRTLTKHKYIIFFTSVVLLVATYIFTDLQKPVYKASCSIKIGASESNISGTALDPMGTEIRIVKSEDVIRRALIKIKSTKSVMDVIGDLEVGQVGDSNMIQITGYSDKAEVAAMLVNAIAECYIEKSFEEKSKAEKEQKKYIQIQLTQQEKELFKAEENLKNFKSKGGISGMAQAYASRLIELSSQLSSLKRQYTEEHPEVRKKKEDIKDVEEKIRELSEQDSELIKLTREVSINESLYNNLRTKFQEAEIAEAGKVETSAIVNKAMAAKYPLRPNKKLNMIIGLLLGLIIGAVAAFFMESLDTTIGSVEDLESFIGLPVLGIIPKATDELDKKSGIFGRLFRKKGKDAYLKRHLILWYYPKSILVEAYHTLRTNISFTVAKDKKKSLIFTSSGPAEGKTFSIINYALSSAEAGMQVVLVEADLRRPSINKIFGFSRENGLSDILLGNITWKEALKGTSDILMSGLKLENIIKVPGIENLKIITCGRMYTNPVDIINSSSLDILLSELKANFDLVVFDCPPILLFADSTILASKVDGVVLIYQSGRTSKLALRRAKSQLDNVHANILGMVLNDVNIKMMPHYGSDYYSSRYYKEDKKNP